MPTFLNQTKSWQSDQMSVQFPCRFASRSNEELNSSSLSLAAEAFVFLSSEKKSSFWVLWRDRIDTSLYCDCFSWIQLDLETDGIYVPQFNI